MVWLFIGPAAGEGPSESFGIMQTQKHPFLHSVPVMRLEVLVF